MNHVLPQMRLRDYRTDLLARLQNPAYAAGYLSEVSRMDDCATLLIARRDVAEAVSERSNSKPRINDWNEEMQNRIGET